MRPAVQDNVVQLDVGGAVPASGGNGRDGNGSVFAAGKAFHLPGGRRPPFRGCRERPGRGRSGTPDFPGRRAAGPWNGMEGGSHGTKRAAKERSVPLTPLKMAGGRFFLFRVNVQRALAGRGGGFRFRSEGMNGGRFLRGGGSGGAYRGGAYGGMADEDRAAFNSQGGGLDVAYEFRGAFQFHAVRNRYIADDLAVDDDGLGVDFRADDGILAYGEHPFGRNVAFNGAVNQQVVGKTQGADNLHVGVQHVAGQLLDARSGGVGSGGGYGFRNRFGGVLALGYVHPAGGGFRILVALGGGNGGE